MQGYSTVSNDNALRAAQVRFEAAFARVKDVYPDFKTLLTDRAEEFGAKVKHRIKTAETAFNKMSFEKGGDLSKLTDLAGGQLYMSSRDLAAFNEAYGREGSVFGKNSHGNIIVSKVKDSLFSADLDEEMCDVRQLKLTLKVPVLTEKGLDHVKVELQARHKDTEAGYDSTHADYKKSVKLGEEIKAAKKMADAGEISASAFHRLKDAKQQEINMLYEVRSSVHQATNMHANLDQLRSGNSQALRNIQNFALTAA